MGMKTKPRECVHTGKSGADISPSGLGTGSGFASPGDSGFLDNGRFVMRKRGAFAVTTIFELVMTRTKCKRRLS